MYRKTDVGRYCDSFIMDSDPTFSIIIEALDGLCDSCFHVVCYRCCRTLNGDLYALAFKSEFWKASLYKERSKKGTVKEDSIACNFT